MTFGESCNCGNCPAIGCKQHGFNSQYPEETQHFSQKKGCLSHPRAREVVMAEVVEELEKNISIYENSCHDDGDKGTLQGLNIALTIIRGGKK